MAKEQLAVAELIMNIMLGRTDAPGRVSFFPQKPKFPSDIPYEQPFPRTDPESQGISSDHLAALIRELAASRYTDMHHLMLLRHGKVICECNFAPYRSGIWHSSYSMCKSITGMAIGMLVHDGLLSLDENIYDIFEKKVNSLVKIFRPVITVENLLTMTSGVTFNESGIVSGDDWLGSYLNASVSGKPGTQFQYNSLNTYVLSAIVTWKTGLSLFDYLKPRLFEPMGITRIFWETCPMGITKGGWGLFICAEDMAKLGQLYLQKGCWNGRQLVPEEWVSLSTQKHVDSLEGTFGYGYQLWMEQRPGSFEFNGMLGQNVIVYPDMDMVIVTNAGNNELFQNCVMLNIIRKYFPTDFKPAGKLPANPCAHALLTRLTAEMETGQRSMPVQHKGGWKRHIRPSCALEPNPLALMKKLDNRLYSLHPESIGLFPLLLQVFHNNMTEGVKELGFSYKNNIFYVSFLEAGECHELPVGFGRAAETWLTLHGESYLIGTLGKFTTDENQTLVLKLEMTFMEESVKRKANIFFYDYKDPNTGEVNNEVEVRWYETPGKGMIMEGLESITAEITNHPLFSSFKGLESIDFLHRLMEHTIEPVCRGKMIHENIF